jgi:D-alanyl-lipoteichoic acid acyltransferase DltB (MBOAT superfamily)
MLFNSIDFAVFLPIVFAVFWWVERRSFIWGNRWLLASSVLFYGWWDWRYLGLVFLSGALDYWASIRIEGSASDRTRKAFLWLSMVGNLGVLGFFKYYDFFVTAFTDAFTVFGVPLESRTLDLVLPVGISFYTFQSMSYTIDVYRRDLKASRNPLDFGAYLLFFPQLVAGPIERATALLPQFKVKRVFDLGQAVDGTRQILWGLFKKVVIADQCAPIVNTVFDAPGEAGTNQLLFASVLFAFQIYGDFSGYSAIGTARLFGFSLMRNFAFPYFSRDIAEFWRRWHISLSTWFRDYLYIPLGGSRGTMLSRIRNTFIIFLVSGFWHGANYTFLVWGTIHALLFLPLLISGSNRSNVGIVAQGGMLPSLKEVAAMLLTFAMTTLAWVFFRADDLPTAFHILGKMGHDYLLHPGLLLHLPTLAFAAPVSFLIAFMVTVEWLQRERSHGLNAVGRSMNTPMRWTTYYALALTILYYSGEEQSFIYFQF